MRESLTILAVAVILLLSALLIGPYFVNWNNQRDFIAAKLSKAAGATVKIAGGIDVKLLPRPIFRVGQVSIAGAAPHDPRVSVQTLDAELSINGLLQGAVEFVDATVMSPRIELTARSDGSIVAPPLDVDNPQSFQFKHVTVTDAAIVVRDEDGHERGSLSGVDAQGEADSLIGPVRIAGSVARPDGRIGFRLNTGAYGARRLRLKLALEGGESVSHVDVDGSLLFDQPAAGGHPVPNFEGALNATGSLHVADGAAPVPWRLALTGAKTDHQTLSAATIELRAGSDGRALVATGTGSVNLGTDKSASIQLHARQLDLDRLAVPPDVAPDTPLPKAAQWIAAMRGLIGGGNGAGLPLALALNVGIDAVTTGDLTLTDAAVVLDAKRNQPLTGRIAVAGPDASRLSLDGAFEVGSAPGFNGRAQAATHDLASLVQWMAPLWPQGAEWIGSNPGVQAIDFAGGLTLSAIGIAARDMQLTVDGSTLEGTLSVTGGVGGERPRLFADLKADRFDTAHLPSLNHLATNASTLDLTVALKADAARLSGSDLAPIDVEHLALHLIKTGGAIALDQFSVAGLGGATVNATAALDADRHLRAEGHVEAKDVAPLAAVLRQIVPGAAIDVIAANAAKLSPLSLAFKSEGTLDEDGGISPSLAEGQGTVGAVRASVSITPEADGSSGTPLQNAIVVLDAADIGTVLRQWGLAAAPLQSGAGHAEVIARGTLQDGFDADASLSLADGRASFNGRATSSRGSGHLTVDSTAVAGLLRTAGLTIPANLAAGRWAAQGDIAWQDGGLTLNKLTSRLNGSTLNGSLQLSTAPGTTDAAPTRHLTGALTVDAASIASISGLAFPIGAPAAGSGRWSTQKFGAMPVLPRAEIGLKIGVLDLLPGLTLREAGLTLRFAPASVTLADLSGRLLGGTAGGTVTLRRDGPAASLAGRIELSKLSFALPSLAGQLSATLDVAGTGPSPDSLMAGLAGDGSVSIAGARMPRLDPGSLDRVAKAFDVDGVTVDDDAVRDALNAALDRGALALGDLTAPATVAAGTLRVVGFQTKTPGFTASSDGTFDVRNFEITEKTTVSTTQQPKDWKGDLPQVTVSWAGPIGTPIRSVDAAAFVNGLASRAIARDQERIEIIQQDIRERAFFARRLKQIEAEQRAARDAQRLQNMLTAPPKPGDIRLPRASDGAPMPMPTARKTQAGAAEDEITKLLNGSGGTPPSPKPVEIQPQPQTAVPSVPSADVPDPTAAGRY